MNKLIQNEWRRGAGAAFERATILRGDQAPEGLDAARFRFTQDGPLSWHDSGDEAGKEGESGRARARIVSVARGSARLERSGGPTLQLPEGTHVFVPLGMEAHLSATAGTEIVSVASAAARGTELLVRDEEFLAACADSGHCLRWILTPQYLSRRVFLHHDRALLSRRGDPVSWFRTTMFDVAGLPHNEEGEPVFKMSYNSRTEFNVCYDVSGDARVRMAEHPYRDAGQAWGPWLRLDSDSTYHLNEAVDGPEIEWVGGDGHPRRALRNKHEVSAAGGHVTLFCVFDPAPTGVERHRPGEYSDYEPFEDVAAREEYASHRRLIGHYDAMVDELSMAKAEGTLDRLHDTEAYAHYLAGCEAQRSFEAALEQALAREGKGREQTIRPWMQR